MPLTQIGTVIATYDVANGITRVIDGPPGEPTEVVARGNDGGVQTFHTVNNLTNYTTHYFGVQAYAFNEPSFPKIYASPITRVEAVPSINENVISTDATTAAQTFNESDFVADAVAIGDGTVTADIANPAVIQAATYTVEFYDLPAAKRVASAVVEDSDPFEADADRQWAALSASKTAAGGTTYDIKRNGTTIFDGSATGEPAPQRANVVVEDGLLFSVEGSCA